MAIRFLDEPKIKFQEEPKQPSFLERLRATAAQVNPLDPQATIRQAQRVPAAFEAVGERTAEFLGERGVDPNIAGGLGTAISIAPDIASAGSIAALRRALSTKVIGKQLGKLETSAGLEQLASSKRRVASGLGLPETAEVGDVINAANKIASEGGRLAPQLAKDLKVFFNKELPRLGKDKISQALGRRAEKFADAQLNKFVKGRKALAKSFGSAKTLESALGSLGRGVRNVGLGAAGVGGTAAILKLLGVGGR